MDGMVKIIEARNKKQDERLKENTFLVSNLMSNI